MNYTALLITSILVSLISFLAVSLAYKVSKQKNQILKLNNDLAELNAKIKSNLHTSTKNNPAPVDSSNLFQQYGVSKIRLLKVVEASSQAVELKQKLQLFFKEAKMTGDALSIDLKTLRQTKADLQEFINLTMELSFLASASSDAIEAAQSLKEEFNELDNNEIQVATLLMNNLKTREIAVVLGTNFKRIEFLRSKIRKKLNLKPDEPINQFITNLHIKRLEHINKAIHRSFTEQTQKEL